MILNPAHVRLWLAAAALAGASAAGAHIVFAEPAATAGGYYAGRLRVSHGCAGSPTVAIRVAIPDGVGAARPQPKPGWTIAIDKAPLAAPVRSEGGEVVRERVVAITWSGRLPADQFDEFGLLLKLPATPGPLYFPTTQVCEAGSAAWTTIPAAGQAWHALKTPAPVLTLSAAPAPMAGMRM